MLAVDNISTFSKMQLVTVPGDRVITLLSAGNLALTQAMVNIVTEGTGKDCLLPETLENVTSMFQAAQLVGRAVREVFLRCTVFVPMIQR